MTTKKTELRIKTCRVNVAILFFFFRLKVSAVSYILFFCFFKPIFSFPGGQTNVSHQTKKGADNNDREDGEKI